MIKLIEEEMKYLLEKLEKVNSVLKEPEKGSLRCTSSNGSPQYYIDGKYIKSKDRKRAKKIAQWEYCRKTKPVLEKMIMAWENVATFYSQDRINQCYESMCDARKRLVDSVDEAISTKIQQFMREEYPPGKFDENNETSFYTINGERVRSKSELIIADELHRYSIPYSYERPLELECGGRRTVFRPDFTIMHPRTGRIIILEHYGMMDNPDYCVKNMRKLNIYEANGYLLGRQLIITHETSAHPLNIRTLDAYIKNCFL